MSNFENFKVVPLTLTVWSLYDIQCISMRLWLLDVVWIVLYENLDFCPKLMKILYDLYVVHRVVSWGEGKNLGFHINQSKQRLKVIVSWIYTVYHIEIKWWELWGYLEDLKITHPMKIGENEIFLSPRIALAIGSINSKGTLWKSKRKEMILRREWEE